MTPGKQAHLSIENYAKQVAANLNIAGQLASQLSMPAGLPDKFTVAWALLRFSFDNAAAINALLFHHGIELSGPAFALLRPMNEALKRGTWIAFCSTDEQVQAFAQEDKLPRGNLAAEIEKVPPFDQYPIFTQQYANAWDKFHSFTHGGSQIVGAYTLGDSIGPAFPTADVHGLLDHVEAISIMVVHVMAMIAGEFDDALGHSVLEQLGNIVPTRQLIEAA